MVTTMEMTRIAPGAACQHCRRLKMKCTTSNGPGDCDRCRKTKRTCRPMTSQITQDPSSSLLSSTRSRSSSRRHTSQSTSHEPEIVRQDYGLNRRRRPRMNEICCNNGVSPSSSHSRQVSAHHAGTATVALPLPSIYARSPAAEQFTVSDHSGYASHVAVSSKGGTRTYPLSSRITLADLSRCLDSCLKPGEATQLIQLFNDRLLLDAPILLLTNCTTISSYPQLLASVAFVLSDFLPGYQSLRSSLMPILLRYVQDLPFTSSTFHEDQMIDLQALSILYYFTRPSAAPSQSYPDGLALEFWSVKTAIEAYARHTGIYHSATQLQKVTVSTECLAADWDMRLKKYLIWLWLFSTSHYVAIVTGTPPTILADGSIRAASVLLDKLAHRREIYLILIEVEMCLLWDQLGRKQPSVREWWCSPQIQSLTLPHEEVLALQDVDHVLATVADRVHQRDFQDQGLNISNLIPDYFFRFSKFCLYTHFTRQIISTNLTPSDEASILRCITAACEVLSLNHEIGPIQRDQIRYSPGFLSLTFSFCSTFVLRALKKFPMLVAGFDTEIANIREIARFMMDIGMDKSNATFAAGRSLLRQADDTADFLERLRDDNGRTANILGRDPSRSQSSSSGILGSGDPAVEDDWSYFHQWFDFD